MSNPPVVPRSLEDAPNGYNVEIKDPNGAIVWSGLATLRQYRTRSWGWHTAGKFDVANTHEQRAQVNIGITVIGSKDWPEVGMNLLPGLEADTN
ncbi:MAG: hypothetical protein GY767_14045 [Shimia sp.]|nr:hypothetical protein [Shimia sp.]